MHERERAGEDAAPNRRREGAVRRLRRATVLLGAGASAGTVALGMALAAAIPGTTAAARSSDAETSVGTSHRLTQRAVVATVPSAGTGAHRSRTARAGDTPAGDTSGTGSDSSASHTGGTSDTSSKAAAGSTASASASTTTSTSTTTTAPASGSSSSAATTSGGT